MKNILHIIPYYQLYPPMNGGQLRCFHLMNELSKYYRLDVICYQSSKSFSERGYENDNVTFYDPKSFSKKEGVLSLFPTKIKNALRYRLLTKTLNESATQEVLEFGHIIKELYKTYEYDVVIFEHLPALTLLPIIKKYAKSVKYILDAHNVDHLLVDRKDKFKEKLFQKIKKKESNLYKYVDGFWACSKNDIDILERLNKSQITGKVVPNGVDIKEKKYVKDKEGTHNTILFCGTLDFYPNKEGLLWFYANIWENLKLRHPDVRLLVVGKGDTSPYTELQKDSKIDFIGEVEDVAPYYKKSFIAIVPLFSGSGTRLKILEAMSFGNPIVTTPKGIEGIEFEEDKHVLLADNAEGFGEHISILLESYERGDQLRQNALQLVKSKYDWGIIVRNLIDRGIA